jgi:nucleoside 2-deoxyribosyltransferase
VQSTVEISSENRVAPALSPRQPVKVPRRIYLAGPFTQHLSFAPAIGLGPHSDATGSTGAAKFESSWRRTLLEAACSLESLGWSVFLPHRDVSAWGEREITPGDVARECLAAVMASDALIAFMGESFGTHVEVGVALGVRIPTVLVRSDESTESYFAGGVASSSLVGELVVRALEELPRVIERGDFDLALDRAIGRAVGQFVVTSA